MEIREVIVVEGKNDSKRIRSFFEAETIETGGLGVSKDTLDLIREASKRRGVILLLDPDHPGEEIRRRINEAIPGLKNAFLRKEDARTRKKVGAEHASEEALKEALSHLVTYGEHRGSLTMHDLYELGLSGQADSKEKRRTVSKRFRLGECNAKTLLYRLNMLEYGKEELMEVLQ